MVQAGPGGGPPEAVPTKQHLLVINSFVVDTTRFLNQFARIAEGKLRSVGEKIGRVEKRLVLLEEKLARVPGIADEPGAAQQGEAAPSDPGAAGAVQQGTGGEYPSNGGTSGPGGVATVGGGSGPPVAASGGGAPAAAPTGSGIGSAIVPVPEG